MRPSELLQVRDPLLALDLDLAIAARARAERDARLTEAMSDEDDAGLGNFFNAVLLLLSD